MSIKAEQKICITIPVEDSTDVTIEITKDEARELRDTLDEILGKNRQDVPVVNWPPLDVDKSQKWPNDDWNKNTKPWNPCDPNNPIITYCMVSLSDNAR